MSQRLRRLVLDNLLLKLVSLALALLIFLLVRSEKQSLAYGTVQLSFTPPTGRILAGTPPTELQLSVLGPASRVPRFRFEDLAAVNIDLSSVEPGHLEFRFDMFRLPPGFSVSSIRPPGFDVRYERLVDREVPVRVALEGQVAAGFRVVRTESSPPRLRLRGPESALGGLGEVKTRAVAVDGARESLVQSVPLAALPAGVASNDLPRQVEARVEIGPLMPKITLSAIPVVVEDPAHRELVADPPQVDVQVEGPPQVLANLPKERVSARVRLAGSERGTLTVAPEIIGLPQDVVVGRVAPETVEVSAGEGGRSEAGRTKQRDRRRGRQTGHGAAAKRRRDRRASEQLPASR